MKIHIIHNLIIPDYFPQQTYTNEPPLLNIVQWFMMKNTLKISDKDLQWCDQGLICSFFITK
jgi:carbonic anhydrase